MLTVLLGVLLLASIAGAEPVDLASAEKKVFSQFGEDGVIEKIFEIIEPTSKFVVEFGALDGVTGCNARNLIVNRGWSAFLIEGNAGAAGMMKQAYKDNPKVKALEAWVFPGNIEVLFEDNDVPEDLDLLVIDIDSNDYYVWKAIHDFRPKVVLLEANPHFPPPEKGVIKFDPMYHFDGSYYYGASAQSLYELAKKKGYELVHHVSGGNNLFFVREDYFDRFGIEDNSPEKIYTPVHVNDKKRKAGKPYLPLKARKIKKEFVDNR